MTLRAEAYAQIREGILRGHALFDERTSERAIAEHYLGVSRTPVREALAVLEATGVVNQIPQVGVEVHAIDVDEALQAVNLRLAMESVIVDELAGSGDRDLDPARSAIDRMRSAGESRDPIEFMLADTDLHTELARVGGFGTSVTALQGLRDRVHLFRLEHPLTPSQMAEVLDEHLALIGAIEDGDPSRAGAELRSHLAATQARIEAFRASQRVDELVRREVATSEQ